MIKHTIEISKQAVSLSTKLGQLVIQPFDQTKEHAKKIPCEDIGLVIIEHPQTSITHGAIAQLLEHQAALVFCGKNHLPAGLLLPFSKNTEQVHRLHEQISMTLPVKKQLWKQVIKAKLAAQASNLDFDLLAQRKLQALALEVKSGDLKNDEAYGAKIYWQAWRGKFKDFKRDPDEINLPNALLNYGYAILRAATARALVIAGLHPSLGLHHANRSNAFCLADDLMEPFRPTVDKIVFQLLSENCTNLDQIAKAKLLNCLIFDFVLDKKSGPLMVQLHRYTASLIRCIQKQETKLKIPVLADDAL